MAELLLELLSEEIPARMQDRAAADLKRLVCERLEKAGLTFGTAEAFATPRRLTLVVDGLPTAQPDVTEERKGPRANAPEKAIAGFLKSIGLTRDQVEERETPKGTVLFAVIEKKGRATLDVLEEIVPSVIESLPWPKSMRWSDFTFRFVRPLHNILCLFDGEVVNPQMWVAPSTLQIFTNTTRGHRFMAPNEFAVEDFADYRQKLDKAWVVLDSAERREIIEQEAALKAKAEGLTVAPDAALVAENAGLVEWPVVLTGAIDPDYLDLPPEVLTTAMRSHQKYFTLTDADGALAPRFLMVANAIAGDGGKQIVAGNERVLRARLADAKFFWDTDRKRSLSSRGPDLDRIIFHAKLGSVGERADRLGFLASKIAKLVPNADAESARRAGELCKADLTTHMVAEFRELQGVMGKYYALVDGKSLEIANAISDHYSPLGPSDRCPSSPVSVAVSLADKIDVLVGFFGIEEKPTGSKDPFALRRAGLGVIRLILENELRFSLRTIIMNSYAAYLYKWNRAILLFKEEGFGDKKSKYYTDNVASNFENVPYESVYIGKSLAFTVHKDDEEFFKESFLGKFSHYEVVCKSILEFVADRLKVHLRKNGVRHDLISAVFALDGEDDLVRLLARVYALTAFLKSDDGEDLLTAYRRSSNIVRIEEDKDGREYRKVDTSLFLQDEERDLWENLHAVQASFEVSLEAELFTESMAGLAQLRHPIDQFFDKVTVNVTDDSKRRANRLALLRSITVVMNQVADFSKIEG